MYVDIGKYYYRKLKRNENDDVTYETMSDDNLGYIVSVSQTYIDCTSELDMKIKLMKDLRREASKLFKEVKEERQKKLTK